MTIPNEITVEMLLSAAEGSIQFRGLPAMEDGNPLSIQILIHQEKKILLLRPCPPEEKNAVRPVVSEAHPDVCAVEKCGLFLDRLYARMRWNLFKDYRLFAVPDNRLPVSGWLVDLSHKQEMPNRKLFPDLSRAYAPQEWSERMV